MRRIHTLLAAAALLATPGAAAPDVYAYVNAEGDYVVSPRRPTGGREYAVLDDDGNFIRLVEAQDNRIPITHWRPWFIPKEPHPFDARPDEIALPEPRVGIEEVDPIEPGPDDGA